MSKILKHYTIHPGTIGLFPAKSSDFQTVVMEENKIFRVDYPALELIKDILVDQFSSYEARKFTVTKETGFRKKLPVPIFLDSLYMFPTHAVKHIDCAWIAANHVCRVRKSDDPSHCLLVFKHNYTIELPVTPYSMRKQLKRAKKIQKLAMERLVPSI